MVAQHTEFLSPGVAAYFCLTDFGIVALLFLLSYTYNQKPVPEVNRANPFTAA